MKNDGLIGFKNKAYSVHGNKFNYSKSFYVNSKTPLTIICPFHGEYKQTPYVHLKTHGCPSCGRKKIEQSHTHSYEYFLNKCNKKFSNKYTYTFNGDNFIAQTSELYINCSCGNEFTLKAREHYFSRSGGCKKCQYSKNIEKNTKPLEYAKKLLNDNFPNLKLIDDTYIKMSEECDIICDTHGIYKTKPYNFQYGHGGCPKCKHPSSLEKIIQEFLEEKNIKYKKNDRDAIKPNEIDFLIDNLGIELCGLYWHCENIVERDYHYKKHLKAKENNIKLFQFFEDEVLKKREIVFSMINNSLGKSKKTYARSCKIITLPNKDKKEFLDKNHIQGDCASSINLALEYNDEILSVMTFSKPRINLGNKKYDTGEYELTRFANKINNSVVGGASKLFSFFIKTYKPETITSYCDLRYSTGGIYSKLGFKYIKTTKPNYFYFRSSNGIKRFNRFSYRKSILEKKLNNFDKNKTEKQNMKDNKFLRIYDCGNMKFVWTLSEIKKLQKNIVISL